MPGPTDLEQLVLELLNETRLDPQRSAYRYITSFAPLRSDDPGIQSAIDFFGVNGPALLSAFSALEAVSPLAWNENLGDAAAGHNEFLIRFDTQSHQVNAHLPSTHPDYEKPLGERVDDAGYDWMRLGENVYSYARSPVYGHAGFMIDWGYDDQDYIGGTLASDFASRGDGVQDPAGHRLNIMNPQFREVGIDVALESDPSTQVGPMVITQNFGQQVGALFVLGVAYSDSDGDAFYSLGEGRGDLIVHVGAGSATSAASGGYQIEVPQGAAYIRLSGGGLSGQVTVTTTIETHNLKLDVVDGDTLLTSGSIIVEGAIAELRALGLTGLTLTAGSGNQIITGTPGNDAIDGGAGLDTLSLSGDRNDYQIRREGAGLQVTDLRDGLGDGTDMAFGIETFRFADGDVAVSSFFSTAPIALSDEAQTLQNTSVAIDVLANDSDAEGDQLTIVEAIGSAQSASVLIDGDAVIYTPRAGFSGTDTFTYTISDGNGGFATSSVSVTVVPTQPAQPAVEQSWRLIAAQGFSGAIGGSGSVVGSDGLQDITVSNEPGTITFDSTFNRGQDIVRLAGDADQWSIVRSGSSAVFTDGDTSIILPVGLSGVPVVFDDGARSLGFDAAADTFRIGNQAFGTGTAQLIVAPPESIALPGGHDASASGRLLLADDAGVSVAGRMAIIGTGGVQSVQLGEGVYALDASFNAGGDVITLEGNADEFAAMLVGSSVMLSANELELLLPVGPAGTQLRFGDEDVRTILYDPAVPGVTIQGQLIGADPVMLAAAI